MSASLRQLCLAAALLLCLLAAVAVTSATSVDGGHATLMLPAVAPAASSATAKAAPTPATTEEARRHTAKGATPSGAGSGGGALAVIFQLLCVVLLLLCGYVVYQHYWRGASRRPSDWSLQGDSYQPIDLHSSYQEADRARDHAHATYPVAYPPTANVDLGGARPAKTLAASQTQQKLVTGTAQGPRYTVADQDEYEAV